ncbi:transcription factor bHLH157 isoform X2 [Argentina anserina]|uniref:transcription factor bHLH157 isoform X2 n=1 Tax=Argentina anserina TaxID=57926 RepID=UPI0021765C51|nr:transcription factor bHLH157 isoform X2 [Potentilla anserina]
MGEAEKGSAIKERLKGLCVCNGWSYGVLWRFDQRNSMLLKMGEAYYEEHMGTVIENMLPQLHMLGEGVIGQTAFTGKDQWMHSDTYNAQWNSCNPIESCRDLFQDDSEFRCQFSSGVKTIATVSVEAGVIQFGSTDKIMERLEFLDETKRVFREIKNLRGPIPLPSAASCLNNESNDLNDLFASLISSANFHGDIANILGDKSKDIGGNCLSAMNLQPTASGALGSAGKTPWFSTESSSLDSYDPHLASDIGVQDFLKTCRNTAQDSTLNLGNCGYQMDDQHYLQGYPVEFNRADCITDVSKSFTDDLSQWFAASPVQNFNGMANTINGDLSRVFESPTVSSSLLKGDTCINLPIVQPATSMQSSITNAFSADAHEKGIVIQSSGNDLFHGLGTDFGCGQASECWEDSIMPVVSGDCMAASTDLTKEPEVGAAAGPRRGLFSELGLEELLNGMNSTSSSVTKCSPADQSSTRKRKLESSSAGGTQVQVARFAGSGGSMHLTGPLYNLDKTNFLVPKKEVLPKSQVSIWIDDSYSVNARSMAQANPQKAEDHTKTAKKRAKPGESTRPRPKDRQQIQDRMKDLRGMIPNGGKCSIDALLDRTVKYMIFLQGVTKHADKLKQPHESKLTGKKNGVVLKDHSSTSGGNNTWALAVEGQNVVCPILVEDLSTPGQMLIEILCEERGFFLELADEIRGFGLNILKGVMESREDKIWARFIVEATRHVTRIEIFWSLVRLLQQSGTSVVDPTIRPNNVVDTGFPPVLDSFQPCSFPPPISLT